MTYGAARPLLEAMATRLDRQVDEARTVGILLRNGSEFVLTIAACALAGCTRVALNGRDAREGLLERLRITRCSVLVTTEDLLQDALGGEEVLRYETTVVSVILADGNDTWTGPAGSFVARRDFSGRAVLFGSTGGTTGAPKAVFQGPEEVRALVNHMWLHLVDPGPGHLFFALTPLSHGSGAFVLPFLLRGGAFAALPELDVAAVIEALDGGYLSAFRVATFLVPSALEKVLNGIGDAPTGTRLLTEGWFDTIVYGGSPAPAVTVTEARKAFGDCLVQLFGQAEIPMTLTVLGKGDHDRLGTKEGYCVGRPCFLVDVWTARPDGTPTAEGEVGEVMVAADHVNVGYVENTPEGPRFTESVFPHNTRDLGYFDENGYLWLVGRNRDMVISGGFNVFPATIEERLRALAGVADVIVAGAGHPVWGEAVVAGIVVEDAGDWDAILPTLQQAARELLAAYERPKAWIPIDQVPITTLGKPDRRAFLQRSQSQIEAALTAPA